MNENSFINNIEYYVIQLFKGLENICNTENNYPIEDDINTEYEYISEDITGSVDSEVESADSEIKDEIENEDDIFCSKCDDKINNYKYLITPCGHIYHKDCIIKCLNQENINSCSFCNEIFC